MRLIPLRFLPALTLGCAAFALQSTASPISITNAGFELGTTDGWTLDGYPTTGANEPVMAVANGEPGWTAFYPSGQEGDYYMHMRVGNPNPADGTSTAYAYSGSLGTFQADTQYTLTILAENNGEDWFCRLMDVGLGLRSEGSISSISWYGGSAADEGDVDGYLTADGAYDELTMTFDTSENAGVVGTEMSIVLGMRYSGPYQRGAYFDDIRLDSTPVPEPATYAMLAGALALALAFWRRR